MKIGVYFTASKKDGGVYQYALTFLDALAKIPHNQYFIIVTSADLPISYQKNKRFSILDLTRSDNTQEKFTQTKSKMSSLIGKYMPNLMKYFYKMHLFGLIQFVIWYSQKENIQIIDQLHLDLIIFPAASDLSYLVKTPAMVAIHDLQHLIHPEFPEVSFAGRWEYRQNSYSHICQKATRILVDSQVGKEDVMKYYKVEPERIVILPFLAPAYLNSTISLSQVKKVLQQYQIKQPYFYYPAKFWQHKNHLRLMKALHRLHQQGLKVSVVFTGSKEAEFGTYEQVMEYAQKNTLTEFVKYLGYVDNAVVSALYRGSVGLVMPTFFGPTNIPILEAWTMKTGVITSDIRGCRDQVGTAGLVANPLQSSAIALAMKKLLINSQLRSELIKKGQQKLRLWQAKDFAVKLQDALLAAS